jgi:hypothetical protein
MCNRMMRFDVPLIDQAVHPYFRDRDRTARRD